ncbi:MAG: hypothetical protein PHV68_08910, partial [Candidatus Gastranaerophilales bacterium]|nr:hypothetical protein [Candidatus Gastranaerophilales bacterium]
AAYIYFLTLIGVKSSTALALSVFWFGIVVISGLIGGIFYIKGKHSMPPSEFNIENEKDDFSLDLKSEMINETI